MFRNAIVRTPASNFASGLTTASLGKPNLERVLEQHAAYCAALEACGLTLTTLDADHRFPDSTFVEDTAILTHHGAILAHPGAISRAGEVMAIRPAVLHFFPEPSAIQGPGILDGGDICEAGRHFFIGLSHRTNEEGARQLEQHLAAFDYTSSVIDVRPMHTILHLKSGLSFIGGNTLVVMREMADHAEFHDFEKIVVTPAETYAANCVRVNDRVLLAAGYPRLEADLRTHGFNPLLLDMSEFQKMDGGLSCLSLRF